MELNKSLSFKVYDLRCELRTLYEPDVKKEYVDGLRKQTEYIEIIPVDVSISKQQKYIQKILLSGGDTICGLFINNELVGTAGIQSSVTIPKSINVSPESITSIGIFIFNMDYRGMGLGKTLVWASAHLFHDCTMVEWFCAGMAKENISSQKSFLSCGFRQVYEEEENFIVLINYPELTKPEFIKDEVIREVDDLVRLRLVKKMT